MYTEVWLYVQQKLHTVGVFVCPIQTMNLAVHYDVSMKHKRHLGFCVMACPSSGQLREMSLGFLVFSFLCCYFICFSIACHCGLNISHYLSPSFLLYKEQLVPSNIDLGFGLQ
jgi:hypothetical protein